MPHIVVQKVVFSQIPGSVDFSDNYVEGISNAKSGKVLFDIGSALSTSKKIKDLESGFAWGGARLELDSYNRNFAS